MSNAWAIACRPFSGLRSLSLALPPWSIASSRLASPRALPPLHPLRLGPATLQRHSFYPPLFRLLEHRQFSATTSVSSRDRKKPVPAPKPAKGARQSKDVDEKEDTPLQDGDVPQAQIAKIFGPGTSAQEGNAVLRALQHRRVTGSLADKGVHFDGPTAVPKDRALNALEYLRAKYPIDEEAAAAAWAHKEAERLEGQLIQRAQDLRLYKKADTGQTQESIYGHSELEALRRRNEEIYAQQKKKEEGNVEKAAKEGNSGTLGPVRSNVVLRRKEKSEWIKYYEEQATMRKEKEAPNMSSARRILPSAAVAAVIVALCYFLAENYIPPSSHARLFPDTPPALATCLTLFGINLLIFCAWRWPPNYRFFNKYFVQTPGYPTAFSVIGNIFSHQDPKHLFMNMLILMGAGPQLHELVGRADFLAIYLAGGVLGSTASLIVSVFTRNLAVSTLGNSGALAATIAALFLLRNSDYLSLPGLPDWQIPVSQRALLASFLVYELWGLTRRGGTGIDHVAHLGGYATGIAGAYWIKWKVAERRRQAEEKKKEMGFLQKTLGGGKDE